MKTILEKLGFEDLAAGYKDNIAGWEGIWKGRIGGFHEYREFNGREYVNRNRKSLGMGKKACEDWADTLWNPETEITIGEQVGVGMKADPKKLKAAETNQEILDEILDSNNFENRFNELIEKTFAFGTGATVAHSDEAGNVFINYVSVQNIYPLKVEYGEITACAFSSLVDNETIALQIHSKAEDGINYLIKNHVFKLEEGGSYSELELPPNMEAEFTSPVKLFQIIKPAIANNVDIGQPLGMSIFANALDEIKGVDQAYTSLDAELRTGRIRAFIQAGGLKWGMDEDGNKYPHYDAGQEEYYILPEDNINEEGTFIKVDAPTLRIEAIERALEKQLTLFGRKVGFGDDSYGFKDGAVYTNTAQIISTNSKFYKTRQKHITLLTREVEQLVIAIMYLKTGNIIDDITVDFDDSIIEDADTDFNRNLMLLNAGYISQQEFFKRVDNLTEELAEAFVEKMVEDQNLTPEVELEGEGESDYKFGGKKFAKSDKKDDDEDEDKKKPKDKDGE